MSMQFRETASPSPGWVRRSILAGFVATTAMTVFLLAAYGVAAGLAAWLGRPEGGLLARWLWALTYNQIVSAVGNFPLLAAGVHLGMGLIWALLYAAICAHLLSGPGWQRGMRFALIPWVLSILVFFPLVGGGVLGLALSAGPLPILGNLLLHLVYGAVLGAYYALPETAGLREPIEITMAIRSNQGAALGIVIGGAAGTALGWWAGTYIDPLFSLLPHPPSLAVALFGGLLGSAIGATIGAFAGVSAAQDRRGDVDSSEGKGPNRSRPLAS